MIYTTQLFAREKLYMGKISFNEGKKVENDGRGLVGIYGVKDDTTSG